MAQTIGSFESTGCGQGSTKSSRGTVDPVDVCNVCALATITKTPVPRVAVTQAEENLERVFTDVMGPFRVESRSLFSVWGSPKN